MADTTDYCFDADYPREAERMRLGESLWDPGTRERLEPFVRQGSRCLEVGAGWGSVARWMVERGAEVTAVDRVASNVDAPGARVVEADAVTSLPEGPYDLVHARLAVQHMHDKPAAVRRMASVLAPGGVLVLEDTDTTSLFSHVTGEFHQEVKAAAYAAMAAPGHYHPRCGLLDVELAEAAGLTDIRFDGRVEVLRGGGAGARFFVLWLEQLRPQMDCDPELVGAALRALHDPRHVFLTQVMVTVTGRRP